MLPAKSTVCTESILPTKSTFYMEPMLPAKSMFCTEPMLLTKSTFYIELSNWPRLGVRIDSHSGRLKRPGKKNNFTWNWFSLFRKIWMNYLLITWSKRQSHFLDNFTLVWSWESSAETLSQRDEYFQRPQKFDDFRRDKPNGQRFYGNLTAQTASQSIGVFFWFCSLQVQRFSQVSSKNGFHAFETVIFMLQKSAEVWASKSRTFGLVKGLHLTFFLFLVLTSVDACVW